jgi:hypothetical protein
MKEKAEGRGGADSEPASEYKAPWQKAEGKIKNEA